MKLSVLHPVKDIKGKIIFDGSQDFEAWRLKNVFAGDYLSRKVKLKDNPQLIEDCLAIAQQSPYDVILDPWIKNFREWLGELWAPGVLFDELRFQRNYDPFSYKHVLTIAVVGSRILELWIKTPVTVKKTFLALLSHDVGKSRIAVQILNKSGDLEQMERQAIYEHPVVSYILNATYWAESTHLCADISLHHHEDRLGSGYPRKIKTNSLILDILTTVDRFDALISERPFRYKKFSHREALDLIKQDVENGKIEGDVLRALVALCRKQKISNLKKIKLGTINRPPKDS